MRKFPILLAAMTMAATAHAQAVQGPDYPPPGGVTYSGVGSITGGTQVRTYSNFNLGATDDLWYGVSSLGLAMDGAIDATSERLTYSAGQSNLAAGTAVYTGKTTIYVNNAAQTIDTLFTMQVTDLSGTALALITDPSISLNGGIDPVLLVTGDFKASLTMQAAYDPSGSYTSASGLFNSASVKTGPSATQGGGSPLKSDIGTGFYYTMSVPEPASWMMMIAGFGAIGFALRQRKTVSFAA